MPQHAILPFEGQTHLCTVEQGEVRPLVLAPGNADAHYFLSRSADRVAVLDSSRRRAGLFDVLPQEPWLRRNLPFATLPRGCVGHAALAWGDTLLVGGRSKASEALWSRSRATDPGWTAIPLPKQIELRGKAIDGLHRLEDQLIAVDDIVTPKWIVIYRFEAGEFLLERCVRLPSHTTYERITQSFLGDSGLTLLSRGVNHGRLSQHAWLLSMDRFKEKACWSAAGQVSEDATSPLSDALLSARTIAEVNGYMVLGCGAEGVLVAKLPTGRRRSTLPDPICLSVPGLATVDTLVVPMPADCSGVFAVGKDEAGHADSRWLSAGTLVAATTCMSGSD